MYCGMCLSSIIQGRTNSSAALCATPRTNVCDVVFVVCWLWHFSRHDDCKAGGRRTTTKDEELVVAVDDHTRNNRLVCEVQPGSSGKRLRLTRRMDVANESNTKSPKMGRVFRWSRVDHPPIRL
ncbi:hypothetical protein A0H81_01921 [Grifola frondosa]|uniref:Uncharacterized protein n=1 Tax=Grifola frondosa TaxID=5627 RepID=A0A1C7MN20_GRIFR|nr:hypothetical protein A0H81_01921 [Grifola frondosa]